MEKKIKIAIFTNIIPNYREGFYDAILKDDRFIIDIYCHNSIDKLNVKPISEKFGEPIKIIKNKSIFNGRLLLQFFPVFKIFRSKYDIVISDGNLRHITQVILCVMLRLIGTKVAIWSTVHSHRNDQRLKSIRLWYWSIYKYFIMYVKRDIDQLNELGFKNKFISSVNNGLDQKKIINAKSKWSFESLKIWQSEHGVLDKDLILASSRILPGKFDSLILAVSKLKQINPNILCCIIGYGPYLDTLKLKVQSLELSDYIHFEGALYDEDKLAPWFLSAKILVHPAPIGLTLMHAFGYGLPVVTHSDWETHGPEFSIFVEAQTGYSYIKGNIDEMTLKIRELLENENIRLSMASRCIEIVENDYNTDAMARNFLEFCLGSNNL